MGGFGVHHSGMLPLMRELIEILYMRKLLKCVFATETFAIGMNLPAKTVVFCGLSKFDGLERRTLTSGEFRQMAGRAGRRGLDRAGIAIVMAAASTESGRGLREVLLEIYTGPLPLVTSHYHMRWGNLLHLLRQSPAHTNFILNSSFRRFAELRANAVEVSNVAASSSKQCKQEVESMVNVLQRLDYVDA